MDELSPTTDACYKPQIPLEYRDSRSATDRRLERRYEDRFERRRPKSEDRAGYYDERERRYDDFRYPPERWTEERRFAGERRHGGSSAYRNEGRNYRDELMERFADMDFEDHHDTQDHQGYYE